MIHEIDLRVRYVETDQMGVVYHGNYLVWFDMARTSYLGAIGYRYRDLEREGFLFAVVEATTRYRRSARYDNWLRVRVWVSEKRRMKFTFSYELYRMPESAGAASGGAGLFGPPGIPEGAELLATGSTVLGCLDPSGKPQPIPAKVLERAVVVSGGNRA